MAETEGEKQPIIIKKIKKGGGGHHGGAWKVAYADFVTAMMAFFLLLWLLNVTTEEQKNAISNYFDPTHPKISEVNSGAGGILAGTSMAESGAMSSTQAPPVPKQDTGQRKNKSAREKFVEKLKAQEQARFKSIEEQIKQAIQSNPEMAKLAQNIIIDMTSEGLRIQMVDQEGASMFPSGSARMFQKTEGLLGMVADIIRTVPNDISVRGHTDSQKYSPGAEYTNWELSADRANSSRRVLLEHSIPEEKVANVQGKADTEHLFPDTPLDPRNRRVSIILLNEDFSKIPLPPGMEDDPAPEEENGVTFSEEAPEPTTTAPPLNPAPRYNKSSGNVHFP
ncbi:MAG: flagellar motor protein MotB [Rhodospirillales bacterium]|nr:flagellar motor protein MotB [Rhodospirillales bacterium]MCB9964998.1 flagellar motor protein MotB [Rhodospirillales bacterium]MCB9973410.1 flagellar motor protein MotB [Rhodospirillales bacterium]MCB9980413.1 flagellar motor protein MotB [Rhodospirillales bacterium]